MKSHREATKALHEEKILFATVACASNRYLAHHCEWQLANARRMALPLNRVLKVKYAVWTGEVFRWPMSAVLLRAYEQGTRQH